MFFRRPRQFIGDVKRLKEIVGVFFESGFGYFIIRLQLRYLLPWRKRLWFRFGKKGPEPIFEEKLFPPEVHLREIFERLGPTFVKLGQLLSMRPDVVPLEYVKEFEKLQSNVATFPFSEVKKIIEAELKKPLEKIFKKFEEKPVAAGSLAQVHRACLFAKGESASGGKNGDEVAVKVQRPGVKEILTRDIHLMFYLAHLIEKYIPESRNFEPVKVVKEFADWTMRELDFTIEAANADRFRFNLQKEERAFVPHVYWDFTSPRVLVTDFVHGVMLNDKRGLKKLKIPLKDFASRGLKIGFRQFFIDGFFHADPHPGNFFALPDGRLCLHDFGIVGYLTPEERSGFVDYIIAFRDKDPRKAAEHLLKFATAGNGADLDNFRIFIENTMSKIIFSVELRSHESLTDAFYRTLHAGARYGFSFNTDLVLLGKALMTLESMIYELDPDFDINREVANFVSVLYQEELRPEKIVKNLRDEGRKYLGFLRELPERTSRLLEKLEKGELGVKIDLGELEDFKREFDRQNDVRVLSLVVVAMIIGSGVILRLEEGTGVWGVSLGKLGFLFSGILLVWLLVLVSRRTR